MSKFNEEIQYGVVKFPDDPKWSNKAKNTGYKTVIIGDCEWFAEDLIEVLDPPVYLPSLSDVTAIGAYNNNIDSTRLHEIAFIDPKTPPGPAINCTQFWKFIPTNQFATATTGGSNQSLDSSLTADTDPVIPAGTLPCFFKSTFKSPGILDNQDTKILYNYRAAKLIIKNLPKELKEEGWKLPDTDDFLNLITHAHKVVNNYTGNDLTLSDFNSLDATQKLRIQLSLTSYQNKAIYKDGTNPIINLNESIYSAIPSQDSYTDTPILNPIYNETGFSGIFQGAVGTCGIYVYGNNVKYSLNTLPDDFNNLSQAEKTLWFARYGLAVNYWGQSVNTSSPSPVACTYSDSSFQGLTAIDGCGTSDSFSYSQIKGLSLYAWTAAESNNGNGVVISKSNTVTISNLTSSGANSIRLCRKLPFKIKQNRNLSLEITVSNNISYSAAVTGANNNISRYIVSPQVTNPASDCIQHIVFDIKNNFGGQRVLKQINFRDDPLSTDPDNNGNIEFTTTVDFAFKLEKVNTSNAATIIASNTYTITTNNPFATNTRPPSFKIVLNNAVTLALNESIRVTLPANFGLVNDSNDTINWYPIITLDSNDADEYSGTAPADTDWKNYKVAKNLPILLNLNFNSLGNPSYTGELKIPDFDIGYTLSGYDNSTIQYYNRRGSNNTDGYFPIIALKPILANEFNTWDPSNTIWDFNNPPNPFIQSFTALTNPQNYNFTPNDPFIFDQSQSGFIEYKIPNPTVNTLSWNIELLGDLLTNQSDFTFTWLNAIDNTALNSGNSGLTYTHHPDTIVKLKIEWTPSSAYVIDDIGYNLGYNCRISPLNCNVTYGDGKYGWDILLTGQSEPSGPSANIICNKGSITTNPTPLILNTGVSTSFTISIPYTNGNGVAFSLPAVSSTGVTGLTLAALSGTLNNGDGNLIFSVTGTPANAGDATFNLTIFDNDICNIVYPVQNIIPNDFDKTEVCPGDIITFNNHNCNIVDTVNVITVDGIPVEGYTVDTSNITKCTITFQIPLTVAINRTVNVNFYNNTALLESLPLFIKPCGKDYFGPDAYDGSQACKNITFTNPDCSIVSSLDKITFAGVEAEYSINTNVSPCQIVITIPDYTPNTGFPAYSKVAFIGSDGKELHTAQYLVSAGCDGRSDDNTPPNLSCLQLLSSDNITFLDCDNNPVVFEEGAAFYKTGWTISFSTELGAWSSRHTYQPYMYMYNSKAMYTLSKQNSVDSFWKHTEKAVRLKYYDNILYKFEIDMIFPGEDKRTTTGTTTTKNSNKVFSAFAISSDSFQEDINTMRNIFNIPFSQFYVYNSFQISGLVNINYLENLRRVDGSWVINEFRDVAKYGSTPDSLATFSPGQGEQMFTSEGVINVNYIDNNKDWYNKRKFVDKWIGLRLIYDSTVGDTKVDLVYLYNVVFNSRPSFR